MSFIDKCILQNCENYNKMLPCGYTDVFLKYIENMNKFLICCIQTIQIQNDNYKKYIIKKGIELIDHTFIFLLYYTLNPELVYSHCEQGFIYYIEFMGQVTINSDNCLPLTTKDATLFVYKKTIFEICKEYRDNSPISMEDSNTLKTIKELTNVYKSLLFLYVDEANFENEKNMNGYELKCLKNIIINILSNDLDFNDVFSTNLNVIEYFMIFIKTNEDLIIHNKLNVIELFVKKFNKQNITIEMLKKNINNEFFNEVCINYSINNINKYVNALFN